ncbi:MAG: ATP-binding protein [Gemmatimonadetes bacterium]|nr:MAG: ATP-binding protein [Gemmatimonadota bacterium]
MRNQSGRFPAQWTATEIKAFLFPNLQKLDPKLHNALRNQATPALLLLLTLTSLISLFIVVISPFSNIDMLNLIKSVLVLLVFIGGVALFRWGSKTTQYDYYLLLITIFAIATWGVSKDVINFCIDFNRYGVVYIILVFFGMVFMPFPPYVSLILGAYCGLLFTGLWPFFIKSPEGYHYLQHIFKDIMGLEWFDQHIQHVKNRKFHWQFLSAWYLAQYLLFGGVACLYRAANIRSTIRTFLHEEDILKMKAKLTLTKSLMSRAESQHVEFKSSARWDRENKRINKDLEMAVIKTIAGFMNAEGGILFIGVDDHQNVVGIQQDYKTVRKQNLDGYELHLTSLISHYLGKDSFRYVDISFISVEDQDVCAIHIQRGDKPVFVDSLNQAFFVRTGNNTQKLNTKEALEYIKKRFR